jgi:CheY-like chemotaxis protein
MKKSERDARNTILLIEEDDQTRLLFKELLKNKGYKVIPTINEAEALEKVANGIGKVDLVLVDLVRKPTKEMLKAGERILEKGRLNVPLIAIAEEYKDELQGTSVQAGDNEYVVYLENGDELFDLFSSLTKATPS